MHTNVGGSCDDQSSRRKSMLTDSEEQRARAAAVLRFLRFDSHQGCSRVAESPSFGVRTWRATPSTALLSPASLLRAWTRRERRLRCAFKLDVLRPRLPACLGPARCAGYGWNAPRSCTLRVELRRDAAARQAAMLEFSVSGGTLNSTQSELAHVAAGSRSERAAGSDSCCLLSFACINTVFCLH